MSCGTLNGNPPWKATDPVVDTSLINKINIKKRKTKQKGIRKMYVVEVLIHFWWVFAHAGVLGNEVDDSQN